MEHVKAADVVESHEAQTPSVKNGTGDPAHSLLESAQRRSTPVAARRGRTLPRMSVREIGSDVELSFTGSRAGNGKASYSSRTFDGSLSVMLGRTYNCLSLVRIQPGLPPVQIFRSACNTLFSLRGGRCAAGELTIASVRFARFLRVRLSIVGPKALISSRRVARSRPKFCC